ncbi:hypothetical protein [Kribbella sp. NPDC048928]|uniref:hypothetical protein n=1 Tax=Kribbella sp. NPDC048928 TaxID=3364111 RepID=UPI00371A9A2B
MASEVEPVADVAALADEICRAYPGWRCQVGEAVADVAENGGFLEFALVTDVFRWGILDAAMKSQDVGRIGACFNFLERMLASPDDRVTDAVGIRVVPWLLHDEYWQRQTSRFAGVATSSALDRYVDGGDWRSH